MFPALNMYTILLLFGVGFIQSFNEVETATQQVEKSSKIHELFDDFFNWSLESYPLYASYIGIHDYDSELSDLSVETFNIRLKECQNFLQRVNELESEISNEADEFNLMVLKHKLEIFIKNFDFHEFYMQMNYRGGFPKNTDRMLSVMSRETYEDYEKMLQRMGKIPKRFEQIIHLMKLGVENNITFHNISIGRTNSSIGKYIVHDPEDSPLYSLFKDGFPENFTKEQIVSLQEKAKEVIKDLIVPAYESLLDYILNEYVTRPDIAITTINRGEEFYNILIERHTGTNYTAQEIQNIGFKEVERIEGEMMKVIAELGHEGMSRKEFSKMIREDPKNFFNTSEDMMAKINHIVHDLIPSKLPQIFIKIPKTKVKVKEEPSSFGYTAFYIGGNLSGKRAGTYYINTYDPKRISKNILLSLSLHESNPGHHFQIAYANEHPDVPMFRRFPVSSYFPTYSSFVEGWALYSEKLGFDLDLYQDPLERFGYYSQEIFRACRLVVDTGIHALGWTREQAIEYMFSHSESAIERIENEIDRYITIPGQALAYKMGELKINKLRSKSENKLGQMFDIKVFHTVILDSYGPWELVEEKVDEWISETLNNM